MSPGALLPSASYLCGLDQRTYLLMKLHSRILGEGPPLVVMHGVFGMSDNWNTLGRRWSEHYQVHLLDMRNHGRSPHSEEFSYGVMSDDLGEYLDDQKLESAYLLGHSMGGKVAMLFASLQPERCHKLIVGDIGPQSYSPHHEQVVEALTSLPLDKISSRQEAQEQFAPHLPEGVRMFLLKNLYWRTDKQLDWRVNVPVVAREVQKKGEALPDQAVYEGPALFLRGGRSDYIRDADIDLICRHFPEAQIETIAEAGHWLHAEKPREFQGLVEAFLAD